MQQMHRPVSTARIIEIARKVKPMEQQEKKQVHPGYQAAKAFASVTELLCTTEAFFLGKLATLTQPELEKARKEMIQILHVAGQIKNRISEEISDRYQE